MHLVAPPRANETEQLQTARGGIKLALPLDMDFAHKLLVVLTLALPACGADRGATGATTARPEQAPATASACSDKYREIAIASRALHANWSEGKLRQSDISKYDRAWSQYQTCIAGANGG